MADDERLTKRERRERAREERRRQEEEEQQQARRRRILAIVVGLLIAGLIAAVLVLAFQGGPDTIEDIRIVDPVAAAQARETDGCVQLDDTTTGNREHFEPNNAPPADSIYTLRPAASGPHFSQQAAPGVYGDGLDERGVVHSMEHGAVVVWYDPDQVAGDTIDDIQSWVESLNASGFANPRSGAGLFSAPFQGQFTSGKPIALRAWGAALDCSSWDRSVGNAFVVDHFGTHGIAPEAGSLGIYPERLMRFSPGAEQTEVPNGRGQPTGSSGATDGSSPTPASTS